MKQVTVDDVRLPLAQQFGERLAHLAIRERDPRAKARRVVRIEPLDGRAQNLCAPHRPMVLRTRHHHRFVSELAQPLRLLVHLTNRRADARIIEIIEEENSHWDCSGSSSPRRRRVALPLESFTAMLSEVDRNIDEAYQR